VTAQRIGACALRSAVPSTRQFNRRLVQVAAFNRDWRSTQSRPRAACDRVVAANGLSNAACPCREHRERRAIIAGLSRWHAFLNDGAQPKVRSTALRSTAARDPGATASSRQTHGAQASTNSSALRSRIYSPFMWVSSSRQRTRECDTFSKRNSSISVEAAPSPVAWGLQPSTEIVDECRGQVA